MDQSRLAFLFGLRAGVTSMSIEDWRDEIDEIDRQLLRLLNARLRIAMKVGALKQAAGLPLSDQERERQVLEQLREENEGPLDEKTVDTLFRHIIDESRRVQERSLETKAAAETVEVSS